MSYSPQRRRIVSLLTISALAFTVTITPRPASAAIAKFFGWGFSNNTKYKKVVYWADVTGAICGVVGVFFPPAGSPCTVLKTVTTVVKIVDPAESSIISGRVTNQYDPSYTLIASGWYGEFGEVPTLPAPPVDFSSFDQALLQPDCNTLMISCNITNDETNGIAVFDFDWGSPGFVPTKNLDPSGHFNILGMYFLPPSPVDDSLVDTTPTVYVSSIIGSPYDVDANGKNAATYMQCRIDDKEVFCGQAVPVPAPLSLLGVGAAFGSIRKLRKFSSQLKTFSMS